MKTAIVYMVAGMSSRFGGKIKQFAKVGPNGETLIEYSINEAINAGFNEVVFIVGEKTEAPFKEMFGDEFKGVPVKYAKQTFDPNVRDKPWGTVDALVSAKGVVDSPFIVCNGDDIYGEETFKILNEELEKTEESATVGYLLKEVIPEEGSVNRGIFETDEDSYVTSIVETFNIEKNNLEEKNLTEDSLCSMNVFALRPSVLEELSNILDDFKKEHEGDRKAECLLPVELGRLIDSGKIKMKLFATPAKWFGVTNPDDEEIVRDQLAKLA